MFQPYPTLNDPNDAIAGATKLGAEKTWRPSRRWNLGLDASDVSNQVRQLKAATVISSPPGQPIAAQATGQVQGQAKPVTNLRIVRRRLSRTQYQVSVSFTPDASDRYFQGVAVNLTQGSSTPLQIAVGKTSPITFIVQASSLPSSINVQSVGSVVDTDSANSPGGRIPLNQT